MWLLTSSGVKFPGNFVLSLNIGAIFGAFTKCEDSAK